MKALMTWAAALLAATGATAAHAQASPDATEPRISRLIVYGDDPCPVSTEEEIVVCARRPEDDRYRIPEPLRGLDDPAGESWAARAETLEYVGPTGIQSCSTVGPGGFTGCWAEMMRQARRNRTIDPQGQPVP